MRISDGSSDVCSSDLYGAAALAGWKRVVDAVHSAGAAIIPQLWHVGAFRRPGVGPFPPVLGVGPKRVLENGQPVVERLSREAIAEIVLPTSEETRVGSDGVRTFDTPWWPDNDTTKP